jgi:predicted nucleic acid-binding protein
MPRKYSIVIADTSCFILLDKINELDLLQKVFKAVTTTREIANEFNNPLPPWVTIKAATNHRYSELLEIEIDKGEASAIALALETDDSLLLLDDQKARRLAEKLSLNYTGTLGVLLKARELGILPAVKPLLQKIQQTNFRFSQKVLYEILREANE